MWAVVHNIQYVISKNNSTTTTNKQQNDTHRHLPFGQIALDN